MKDTKASQLKTNNKSLSNIKERKAATSYLDQNTTSQ